jgi:hypothetical protein
MVWAAVSIGGLLMETSFIVFLGRRVTGPFEEAADPDGQRDIVRRR